MSKLLRPRVWSNFAITLDGKISTKNHTPASFTSKEDKKRLTLIRSLGDALMVGRATLVKDNMAMGLPNAELRQERVRRGQSEYPLRVIISNSGEIPTDLKVFQKMVAPVVIFTTQAMPERNREELRPLASLHFSEKAEVQLPQVLEILAAHYDVKSLCCEGGPTLFRSMLNAGLIDELYLTISPKIFGGTNAPTLTGVGPGFLEREHRYRLLEHQVIGEELFLRYESQLQS